MVLALNNWKKVILLKEKVVQKCSCHQSWIISRKKKRLDWYYVFRRKQNNSLNNEKSYSEIPADQKPLKV